MGISFISILIALFSLFLMLESTLYSEILEPGLPTVRIYKETLSVSGNVIIGRAYTTRIIHELDGTVLKIKFKGLKIPMSRIEGEYLFEIDINREAFNTVVMLGNDGEEQIIYSK